MTSRSRARALLVGLVVLAAAIGVAACGSSNNSTSSASKASGQSSGGGGALPGKGKPPFTLGDKNFTEEYILGYLYKDALEAKGYTINLKPNIGATELVDKSLTSGKIDGYPEYMGVVVTVLAGHNEKNPPKNAEQNYQIAKQFEAKRGFTVLNKTSYFNADALAVLPPYAKKYNLHTNADLAKVPHWTYGGPEENKTRYEGVVGLEKAYHLHNFTFVGLQEGQAYPALDAHKIDVAAVFTTDGQLEQKGKYVILSDPKHIFGFQNVAPVINTKKLKAEGPAFADTLNKVDSLLTNNVMRKLNAAVALDKQDPSVVAKKFLQANGLA